MKNVNTLFSNINPDLSNPDLSIVLLFLPKYQHLSTFKIVMLVFYIGLFQVKPQHVFESEIISPLWVAF